MIKNLVIKTDKNTHFNDVCELNNQIYNSENIEEACEQLSIYIKYIGASLLSVKIQDSKSYSDFVKPYMNWPDSVQRIGVLFASNHGCPLLREAKQRLEAFDTSSIDLSHYPDFLDRRFLLELKQTEHSHIAVVPVIVGRAIAQFNIGLFDQPFTGSKKDLLLNVINQVMPTLSQRFPEISSIFEKKHLSSLERKAIKLLCAGTSHQEIQTELGYSEHVLRILIDNASKKLDAENLPQLIYRAVRLKEV